MQVVQIVKRYGTVGGMEEYVFRISTELSNLGLDVIVLCEDSCSTDSSAVQVVELGESSRSRWFSHYKFSRKVSRWLAENPNNKRIVHSHERQLDHNVTTFHTTPFGHDRGPFFRFLSLRNFFYEELERREVLGRHVRAIVPVSNKLGELILIKHIAVKENLVEAIHPGVAAPKVKPKERVVSAAGGTIGFIGKEWERKGLPKVVQIWRDLKKSRPSLKLSIAGPLSEEVKHLFFSNEKNYELLGYVDDKLKFFESIDVLVHPAKLEAFGMVITEALSFGVPVLCSTECGGSEALKRKYNSSALSHNEKNEFWLSELGDILSNVDSTDLYERSWEQVAQEYRAVYESIACRV